jgi:hypothetical protein
MQAINACCGMSQYDADRLPDLINVVYGHCCTPTCWLLLMVLLQHMLDVLVCLDGAHTSIKGGPRHAGQASLGGGAGHTLQRLKQAL